MISKAHIRLWVLLLQITTCHPQNVMPSMSTFFVFCNYHGDKDHSTLDTGEVAVSVSIAGNPDYYVPNEMYEVTVTSSKDFNGFMLLGLSTTPSGVYRSPANTSPVLGISSDQPFARSFMCSMVHNHISPSPTQQLSFIWMAPQAGVGCLSFIATATLGRQVLFKDTTVLRLCEEGAEDAAAARPALSALHEDGVILRDDFDSSPNLDPQIWSYSEGVSVSHECGSMLHGNSAVFCKNHGNRSLTSVAMNLTSASVLQFTVGRGKCGSSYDDGSITVSYGSFHCTNWINMDHIRSGCSKFQLVSLEPATHLLHLPVEARKMDTCIRWEQEITAAKDSGCWALDNVVITNLASSPALLTDNFDPIDLDNWLFFPGGKIKHKCHSEQHAMVFNNDKFQSQNYLTSRDLDLNLRHPESHALIQENFEGNAWKSWHMKGGHVTGACGEVGGGVYLSLDGHSTPRMLCSNFINMSMVASVRFILAAGTALCPASRKDITDAKIYVYTEDRDGYTEFQQTLILQHFMEPREVSIPLSKEAQHGVARVCWIQKKHGGLSQNAWMIDNILFLPLTVPEENMFLQFSLNLHCASTQNNNSLILDFSTDHGKHWHPVYSKCAPGKCGASRWREPSIYKSEHIDGWMRMTVPLPLATQTSFTRFRWKQREKLEPSNWAIDNVYIGQCEEGCNGHGFCSAKGCRCDFGYEGPTCAVSSRILPTMLIDDMSRSEVMTSHFAVMRGLEHSYACGVIASGKALVFNRNGHRELQTMDLDTRKIRYLQFSLRVGSGSPNGACPSTRSESQEVFLHFTCDGGVHWTTLRQFSHKKYIQPLIVLITLPDSAKHGICRFRWWQPEHSGQGHDVWAVDDLSLTSDMYNTIDLDFSNSEKVHQALDIHLGSLGEFCDKHHTLRFVADTRDGETRYLVTSSMLIGPSYMLQFDLVIGCRYHFLPDSTNEVYLEYSTDHGMTWNLVRRGCQPSQMCDEYHPPSIYDSSRFTDWSRVTIILPQSSWSVSTRFRWRQEKWANNDNWAISNLYIGQQCPLLCGGHGTCHNATCRCDKGFQGTTCLPQKILPTSLRTDFSMTTKLSADWLIIHGGKLVGANQGCGTLLSAESMYFSQAGARELISTDLDLRNADFVQFYIRIGGKSDTTCHGAEDRSEGVILQYSIDGGVTWRLLKELHHDDYREPKFVHVDLPMEGRASSVRLWWWQPSHDGEGQDQWAIDEVYVASYEHRTSLQDDFQNDGGRVGFQHAIWQTLTEGMYATYCQSQDNTLMFANQPNHKFAMTKDLSLQNGDVIQFKINVGCSKIFTYHHPVLLEYSMDSGMTWSLVEQPCYVNNQCQDQYTEGSIYHTGPYGEWTTVVILAPKHLLNGGMNLRWWQHGGESSFAIDDVYVGPPCPALCHGHGVCMNAKCQCDPGYGGSTCISEAKEGAGLLDRFDNVNRPGNGWQRILGGRLSTGCGVLGEGNSLYFDGPGSREARTVAIDVSQVMMLEFLMRIGSHDNRNGCRKPSHRNEAVILDYSLNNGITWSVLRVLDAEQLSTKVQKVSVELPKDARSKSTTFRWWQHSRGPGKSRAEWAIDNVVIAVNESSPAGFQETFDPMAPNIWYMAMNAIPKVTCHSKSNALEFSKLGQMRYAETWDYLVTSSSFLQFDLAMGCSGTFSALYSVMLEYSTDMGKSWAPVVGKCLPPQQDCAGYHLSSDFDSQSFANWTRITLYLPTEAISAHTRFRWLQQTVQLRGNVWALDNIYLGEGCPWMCSGHGSCDEGTCVCDQGYFGAFCVPSAPLPQSQRDDFEAPPSRKIWTELYGAELSNICGTLVSGTSLVFFKENLRMIVTQDLDVSMAMYVEFTFKYGCHASTPEWPKQHGVLLQYSNNGGILWHLLHQIYYKNTDEARYFTLRIPTPAQTNATRFRFWQPQHDGAMKSMWSLDNVLIGGSMLQADFIYETFDNSPYAQDWQFWPGGKTQSFCHFNTRSDTILAGATAIAFESKEGEHSITSRDVIVNELTVVQFDINVGCTAQASHLYPVLLQYSADQGKSWHLVSPLCSQNSMPTCSETHIDSSVYYSGMSEYWMRVTLPMTGLQICGSVRFRWYQGHVTDSDLVPDWALDNVYIGIQCSGHCGGHGTCISGVVCQCDEGYEGDYCVVAKQRPTFLKEEFDGSLTKVLDSTRWLGSSGAELTDKCGTLLDGRSVVFSSTGQRTLITRDLDLSSTRLVQFIIKLGCRSSGPDPAEEPVLLQYSTNGGISWATMEQYDFRPGSEVPAYKVLHLVDKARTNSTRIRWIQHSSTGQFLESWALDQVYIGGDVHGRLVLQDDLSSGSNLINWLETPGSLVTPTCGSPVNALLFSKPGSLHYAVTADVTVTQATYLQFYLSMGCHSNLKKCYGVELQYSLDFGKTWLPLKKKCYPSDVDCTSYNKESLFTSDVYYGWNRITYKLPSYTRSKATRFRWNQQGNFTVSSHPWALSLVYIGDECTCSCNGHGRCQDAICQCDKGWEGESCTETTTPLPTHLMDDFTSGTNKGSWELLTGSDVTTLCGVLGAGPSLHFKGACQRQAVTRDLDLRLAVFVHFHFRFGCLSPPSHRDQGVVLDFSTNGGVQWNHMIELYHDQYPRASYIMVELPEEAKENGVRLRWWQPEHAGASKSDWAIDNVVIGGNESNPFMVQDGFLSDSPSSGALKWIQYDNTHQGAFCGHKSVMTGVATNKENVTLATTDVDIKEDYMLQFEISVGCNASWDAVINPVYLQFSLDYGMKWRNLSETCLPFYTTCKGKASTASVYYGNIGWQRVTIKLDGNVVSSASRFRWHQMMDEVRAGESTHMQWGVDRVYIGPACSHLCSGHGWCQQTHCLCDEGYTGSHCQLTSATKNLLKDTFESSYVDGSKWSLVQGGHPEKGCMTLVSGKGLHFTGEGLRQAVTVPLDLRNSRFVEYYLLIGGPSTRSECGKPKSRDESIVLQYSTDGGITWETLHILDYASYWSGPVRDYIPLPPLSRTRATQLRWWQMAGPRGRQQRVGWTLDDVYIGGSQINPSGVHESFKDSIDDLKWEFYPNSKLVSELCGRDSGALFWSESPGLKSLTTSQLIIQENYMIQFKIFVGCENSKFHCNQHQAVWLLYNKDPSTDVWDIVTPRCYRGSHQTNMECHPYEYSEGSIYTANSHSSWTRVTILLPAKTYSSSTQFRWAQKETSEAPPSWGLDDVYIGETCRDMCSGRGDCYHGKCHCDPGYQGQRCQPIKSHLPSHMIDNFEGGISAVYWSSVIGGGLGMGCGPLLPLAHGKSLYFNGCGVRWAITAEMDTTKASKVMFVIQIGSHRQVSSCHVDPADPVNGAVLLQYTTDKGISWNLISSHLAQEYMLPRRVAYDIPQDARRAGIQFRWWQPQHRGKGHDQWAVDYVEIIMTRQEQMLRTAINHRFGS